MFNIKKVMRNIMGDTSKNKIIVGRRVREGVNTRPNLEVYPEKTFGEKRCVYTDECGKRSITTYPEGMVKVFGTNKGEFTTNRPSYDPNVVYYKKRR